MIVPSEKFRIAPRSLSAALLAIVFVSCAEPPAPTFTDQIDHRFAPIVSQTVIGLPEDWHKSTINEKGAFTYDYGPGPYAIPETVVGFTSDLPLRVDTVHWAPVHRAWPVVVRRDSLGRVFRHEAWTADAFGDIGTNLSTG